MFRSGAAGQLFGCAVRPEARIAGISFLRNLSAFAQIYFGG
jgi:hypothetical protein